MPAKEIQLVYIYFSYLKAEYAAATSNVSKCQIYIQALWNSQFPKQKAIAWKEGDVLQSITEVQPKLSMKCFLLQDIKALQSINYIMISWDILTVNHCSLNTGYKELIGSLPVQGNEF